MIYFLRGKDTGRIKIGYTESVNKRWEQLEVGAEEYELLLVLSGDKKQEKALHKRFNHLRFKGEWFEPDQELLDFIESFSPRLFMENEKLARELKAAEQRAEKIKEEIFQEIVEKVFRPKPTSGGGAIRPESPKYIRTSVKADKDETAEEEVRRLVVEENIWAFHENTKLRKRIKPGDYICFYASKLGIIAHARVKTAPKYMPNHPKIRHSKEYPWVCELEDVKYYPNNPVNVKEILPKLEMASNEDPVVLNKKWGIYFQGTTTLTEHDFKLLTRQR